MWVNCMEIMGTIVERKENELAIQLVSFESNKRRMVKI